jgi:hypothetical protein
MRKLLTFLIALGSIIFAVCSPAHAFGCKGWPQIAGGNGCNSSIQAAASYTGPGDVVSGATAWGSCARVYSNALASTSTSLCDLVAVTGGAAVCTLRGTTSDFVDLASSYCAGTTPSAACAAASGGSCKVTKVYDQTGSGNHFVQATLANMPPIAFSTLSGLRCFTNNGTAAVLLSIASLGAIAQPITYVAVAERTGNFTSLGRMMYPNTGGLPRFSFNSTANQVALNATNNVTATASDSAFHALQGISNGASSAIIVDSTANTGLNAGTTGIPSTSFFLLSDNGADGMTGTMCEAGIWPSAFNATQYGNMNTNIHSATSGYNF